MTAPLNPGDPISQPNPGEVLTGESVKLLRRGDWCSRTDSGRAIEIAEVVDRYTVDDMDGRPHEITRLRYIGRPDADGWIAWSGGENPMGDTPVNYRVRSGSTWALPQVVPASALRGWVHSGFSGDIIAFRIVRPEPVADTPPPAAPDGYRNVWTAGDTAFFEYHCWEDHASSDAELWYRSRQAVVLVGLDPTGESACADTFVERADAGMPLTYIVRFSDGFEAGVTEDELLTSSRFQDSAFTPGIRPIHAAPDDGGFIR